jgi:hypothetical protein
VPGSPVSIPGPGILPYAKSRFWKSEVFSPQFGIIDRVKEHAKGGSIENLVEREKGLSDRQCAYEEAHQDLKRTSEMVGAPGRFSLSENIIGIPGQMFSFPVFGYLNYGEPGALASGQMSRRRAS